MESELPDREKVRKFWGKGSPVIGNAEGIELRFESDGWKYVPMQSC